MALFSILMAQGTVWYTAQFYTQVFLERVMKVEPRVEEHAGADGDAGVARRCTSSSPGCPDKVGRKPVILLSSFPCRP